MITENQNHQRRHINFCYGVKFIAVNSRHDKLWCGAQQTPPHPLLPPSECNWLWAMAGDNKLTFDPPTRLPELNQNLIRSSHGHSTPSLKISCKSVQPFYHNVADKETNKETKKSPENNTPSPYRGKK